MFVPYHEAMERLVKVVRQLSQARSLDAVMEIASLAARDLTGADGATFVLREGDLCHYAEEDAVSPLWKGHRFPMSTCISGWAMLNRKAAVIEDIYADERIPADAYRPTFVKSLVVVPIRTAAPIGAIGAYWAEMCRPPREVVKALQALADTASVAIENVRLYEDLDKRVREQTKELTETNEKLRQAHERAESVLAGVAAIHIVFDPQWRFVYTNEAAVRAFGRPREQLLRSSLWEVYPDIIGTELEAQLRLAMANRTPVSFDFHYLPSDTWWENRLCPVPEGLAVFATDITARKRMEVLLRESEERFRQITENIDQVLWITKSDLMEVVYISPAYERLWGRSRQSLYENPKTWLDAVHPEDIERVVRKIEEGGITEQTIEYRVVRPDGSVRHVLDHAFPVLNESGEVHLFAGVADDITEHKMAEEKLRESEEWLSLAIEATPIGMFDCNLLNDKWELTEQYKTIMGYTAPTGMGSCQDWIDRLHPEDRVWVQERFRRAMAERTHYQAEYRVLWPDGSVHWVEANGLLSFDSEGRAARLLGTVRDITKRKEAELELREKSQRLEELNAAMRALLRQRDEDRVELEESILANVKNLILPYTEKLGRSRLSGDQKVYLGIIESHLAEITRPFARSLAQKFPALTPTEMRIADLIRDGKTGKEIAGLLNVSQFTILAHRQNIRRKLGIKKGKVNLGSFLRSFTQHLKNSNYIDQLCPY